MSNVGHQHACAKCGHPWDCIHAAKSVEKCKVTEAAKVNGEGPWCALCQNLEMARRSALHRGFWPVVDAIQKIGPLYGAKPTPPSNPQANIA